MVGVGWSPPLLQAREMMNPTPPMSEDCAEGDGSAGADETELVGEYDISSISTISKVSSNFTDIDGKTF